jgi:putative hydrolase of the HAD superfamily
MNGAKAIVFDLDDTLYLERDFVFSGFRACGDWMLAHSGVAGFENACERRFRAGQRTEIFNDTLAELGISTGMELVRQLLDVYRNHRPAILLAPDAREYLADNTLPVGIITDGLEATQLNKIHALGLERIAQAIVCTGQWGREYWKPHHRGFIEAERLLSHPGKSLVYVADNPLKDFAAPRERGWLTVQISRQDKVHNATSPDRSYEPHCKIASFTELNSALNHEYHRIAGA